MSAIYDASQADDGSQWSADCGCQGWTQNSGDEFVIVPCSPACPNYQYAVRQTKAAGNPIRYKEI